MKILLAEDDKVLSDTLVTLLKKNQYETDAVYDGRSALAQLETEYYDCALIDVMMPKMDGIAVIKLAREAGITVPILILTAKAEIESRISGLDSGANDYLPKPFDTRELLARIRAMLRMEELSGTGLLQTGGLKLDLASMVLSYDTGSFRLSGKEMSMMKILMRTPGKYIPLYSFTEKSGIKEIGEADGTVEAYVMFLNRKLDALHTELHIRSKDGKLALEGGWK